MTAIWWRDVASPTGPLRLVASTRGLREVRWLRADEPDVPGPEPPPAAAALLDRAERQLAEYFAGDRTTFDLPLDPLGTPFQVAAWRALATIPYGQTVSYAEQASRLGRPRAARAVGAANGRNPLPIILPCHRVVAADGGLGGFSAGLHVKRRLLDLEAGRATPTPDVPPPGGRRPAITGRGTDGEHL